MKTIWKKILVSGCALTMLMTASGMTIMAEELQEGLAISEAEVSAESVDTQNEAFRLEEETVTYQDNVIDEEIVGNERITVGNGVKATFDDMTGAVTLYSNGGTLWKDWIDKSGFDREWIESIEIASGTVYLPADSSKIFAVYYEDESEGYCSNLKELNLKGFDTSRVTNMDDMFAFSTMSELDLSNFDTSRVTNMDGMFSYCENLTSLDLSGFDTSHVTDMGNMFYWCFSLATLNIHGFDTSNVKYMSGMFSECKSLKSLDLSSFDTSNVTDISNMFMLCSSLTKLDLSSFNTSKVNSINYDGFGGLFWGCSNLKELNLSDFDLSNVTNMNNMFYGCRNLKTLNLSKIDTSKVKYMCSLFEGCTNLVSLDMSGFDTSSVCESGYDNIFKGCSNMSTLHTPKKNSAAMVLPATMYDESGKAYAKLPVLSKSISLTKVKPATVSGLGLNSFSDVQDPKHAYYKAIYWAADAGITKGYPDGTFGIDRSCTRGEMIMFLWRYSAKPSPKAVAKSPFSDVPKTHAFYNAILWASQKGITKGYPNGTFGINRNVSRGECMMFLWRLKGKLTPKAVSASPFKDVPKSHAFYKAILWGYQKGITTGYTSGAKKGTFGINENCTRGAIVTFLYRAK